MKYKSLAIVFVSLSIGAIGGYSYAVYDYIYSHPSLTDVQVRSFSASYGTLRNIKEKNNEEVISLSYAIMNNSLKEMYKLYPDASVPDKEMIYISYKGYADYIKNNAVYTQTDQEVNDLVESLIKKHNN